MWTRRAHDGAAVAGGSGSEDGAKAGIRHRWRQLGLVGLALVACEDSGPELPPIALETDRARIALDEHYERDPPCHGDLDHIDEQVARVEELLGVERPEPVSIFLGVGGVDDFCSDPENQLACYRHDLDWIFGPWQALDHELVHAVARDIQFPSLFWSEGTAEMLSRATQKSLTSVLTPDLFAATELINYVTPAHFSRFVVETYGWDAFNRIIRGESIEDVLGMSALEATQRYEEEAPYSYPRLDPCPYAPLASVGEGRWQETVAFTCESPDASSFEFLGGSTEWGPVLLRSLELEAGDYEFEFDGVLAYRFVLLGCLTEQLDVEPEPPSNGDLYNEAEGAGTEFPAVGRHTLTVTDGTYRIALVGAYAAPADATATFTVTRVE
ncbi:MAG TPA: hypothetical protein VFG69_18165 [Nannocystaceae bacterium]|nr:hypothetical protein [Nannocystaceae bacterium]